MTAFAAVSQQQGVSEVIQESYLATRGRKSKSWENSVTSTSNQEALFLVLEALSQSGHDVLGIQYRTLFVDTSTRLSPWLLISTLSPLATCILGILECAVTPSLHTALQVYNIVAKIIRRTELDYRATLERFSFRLLPSSCTPQTEPPDIHHRHDPTIRNCIEMNSIQVHLQIRLGIILFQVRFIQATIILNILHLLPRRKVALEKFAAMVRNQSVITAVVSAVMNAIMILSPNDEVQTRLLVLVNGDLMFHRTMGNILVRKHGIQPPNGLLSDTPEQSSELRSEGPDHAELAHSYQHPLQTCETVASITFEAENINSDESTTFIVAAVDALHHIKKNTTGIVSLMSSYGINGEDFTVLAGFNEDLIVRGVGHLQQIYLTMLVDFSMDPALQEGLGKIFSPYPGVIQMPSNSLQTSVFQDNGEEWDFDDLVLTKLQEFSESKVVNSDASTGLISVQGTTLAHTSQQYSCGLGDSSSSQSQNGGQENAGGSGGRDGNQDNSKGSGSGDHPEHLDGDGSSPEPDRAPSKKKEIEPVARFLVEAKILRRATDPYPFQTLTVQGILATTHDDAETSHVHFKQLRSQNIQSKAGLATSAYQQYLAHLVIDSGCGESAYVMNGSPRYTRASESKKMTTSQETGRIAQITGAFKGILAVPTMELSGSASVSTKGTLTSESMKRTSCIIQKDFCGRIWWSFAVDDEYEQQHGLDIPQENLPCVDFRLCPDLPATLSDTIQVEVASYWKLPSPTRSWSVFKPELPELSFQNLCLVVAMQLPSNLKRSLGCHATLQKIPGRPEKLISYRVSPELSATARMQHIQLTESFGVEGPEVPALLDKITRHEFIAQDLIAGPLPSSSSTITNTQSHPGNVESSSIQAGPSTFASAMPVVASESSSAPSISAWKGKGKELAV
ncbi:hypothetical protein C8J56DRAFT_902816 [Mycena floridula]|nr:hypothetical protein C8J56DRAFT_902816 [Mycena floridula]